MDVVTLPAVGLVQGRYLAFVRGFVRSYRMASRLFREARPEAALAMGGFTSAPPVLAARRRGAKTFLHESNTIPGRANRWLARFVDEAFVGFPDAAERLGAKRAVWTGTPVRPQFAARDAAASRAALGLDPARPVLLVMGGSQGARAINELVMRALPGIVAALPELQLLHLTGSGGDAERVREVCARERVAAVVREFLPEMHLALGAATVAVSRAGASSLAELAAMRVPSVLIPYPTAMDDHQLHNARAFEATGAARVLEQRSATPESLTRAVLELALDTAARIRMQAALAEWHRPNAARNIANAILARMAWLTAETPAARRGGPGFAEPDEHQTFSMA